MSHLRLIKTPEEHAAALARVAELMEADPAPGSSAEDELDVLALLIEKYEQEHFPIDPPDPIDAIKFRMDQLGLKQKDLTHFIGSASKVSEVLKGERKLSLNMIRKLSTGLEIPAEILIRDPDQRAASLQDSIDWHAFPLSTMLSRGYFEGFEGSLGELKDYASEVITKLMRSASDHFCRRPTLLRSTAHLRSNTKQSDSYALWAWQLRVLQKASKEGLLQYQPGTLTPEWMRSLAQLSRSPQAPLEVIKQLNHNGIHVIIERHLPKTYLDGAACYTDRGNPVVALTLRYDRLDNFWFTLMHELAHIALHFDGGEQWFLDDLDAKGTDDLEQEADELAQESLIPTELFSALPNTSAASVQALAAAANVGDSVVAGRLRHETGNHRLFGSLYRDKIKHILLAE